MKNEIVEILEKCCNSYSKGELYIFTEEDSKKVCNALAININKDTEITDDLYDEIYFKAKSLFSNNKFFNNITVSDSGYGEDIIHTIPMGSMDELKAGDWDKWKVGHHAFILSDKLDGCSVILTYKEGKLFTAATRGRGIKGKDIMRHANIIKSIPKKIPYKDELIVRGELLFLKSIIDWKLSELQKETGKVYKNGRNSISGLLCAKEPSYSLADAKFVAYWTSKKLGNSFELLTENSFEVPYNHIIYTDYIDDNGNKISVNDEFLINCVKTRLKQSDYELDGIILTQLDNIQEGFETGTINPKASRKFKIGIYNNIAESVVTNINWQISKFGKFTPVLEIEPREVSGCTVTNVTGHNYKNVLDMQCGIGSKVKICRSGLVIPYLLEVLEPSTEYNLPDIKTKIEGVDLLLDDWDLNDYSCEAFIQDLVYFGRKLNIDQMGYGNCKKLFWDCMRDNIVLDPLDLLALPEGLITAIIGKNGKKIEACLKAKKTTSTEVQIAAALSSFGEGIGERVLNLVFDKYGTLDVSKEQLKLLDGFGDVRISQYLNSIDNWKYCKEILSVRLGWKFKENTSKESTEIICFSGIRDKIFATWLEEKGMTVTDAWNSKVTCLVVKDINASSGKIKKAKEKGIKISSLEDFKKECGYND